MSSRSRQAVILAGGKGTRLRPYTANLPKPLVSIGQIPILEVVIRQLCARGFRDIVVSTGHLAERIEAFLGNGKKFGVTVRYVHESKPLSTAGALSLIRDLDDTFLVMNGDILTTLDYRRIFDFHTAHKAEATLGVFNRDIHIDFGVVHSDDGLHLSGFDEKPVLHHYVSMGVNVLSKRAIAQIPRGKPLAMPDLLEKLRVQGRRVICYKAKGHWFDIGSVEQYHAAVDFFEKHQRLFLK